MKGFHRIALYCARPQNAVFWRCYFLCGALYKSKGIVILRSRLKQRTTRKRARQKPHFVAARSIIIIAGLSLAACSRSPESNFYVLNPIPAQKQQTIRHPDLRIGIEEIDIPSYMTKQQFILHYTPHHVKLNEYQQWAGALDKNIRRVVETNLSTLLPGAVVAYFPWGIQFKPNYQLRINISQFEVDTLGNTLLRATYIIYSGEELREKRTVEYRQRASMLTVDSFVKTMNDNLNHLTQDIAKTLSIGR
jgi:hypothetical protein